MNLVTVNIKAMPVIGHCILCAWVWHPQCCLQIVMDLFDPPSTPLWWVGCGSDYGSPLIISVTGALVVGCANYWSNCLSLDTCGQASYEQCKVKYYSISISHKWTQRKLDQNHGKKGTLNTSEMFKGFFLCCSNCFPAGACILEGLYRT